MQYMFMDHGLRKKFEVCDHLKCYSEIPLFVLYGWTLLDIYRLFLMIGGSDSQGLYLFSPCELYVIRKRIAGKISEIECKAACEYQNTKKIHYYRRILATMWLIIVYLPRKHLAIFHRIWKT